MRDRKLGFLESKIVSTRLKWLNAKIPGEAQMCERFVNDFLERWLRLHDQKTLETMK